MTDFDSDFIYAANQEEDEMSDEGVYFYAANQCVHCGELHDSQECQPIIQQKEQKEYDRNEARESKATRAVADFTVWWEKEGYRYGQDKMSLRNAFIAGMIAQLQEERERLLRRLPS